MSENIRRELLAEEKKIRAKMARLIKEINLQSGHLDRIVQKLLSLGEREIPSRKIGEMVMEELYKLDKVAYIRFASVYRSFQDAHDFQSVIKEVQRPQRNKEPKKP